MDAATLPLLAAVLRSLAGGADPAAVLDQVVRAAVRAAHGRHGVLVGVVDGAATVVASTGPTPRVVVDVAHAAISDGRLARRTDRATGAGAVAHPVRAGGRIVGALAVGGEPWVLDPETLPAFADAAALAVARRPTGAAMSVPEFSDTLLEVGIDLDVPSVLARALDAAGRLFGAVGGLCVVPEGEGWRVGHTAGIAADDLRAASQHPEFRAFVTPASLRVERCSHPVVAALAKGTEVAASIPLVAAGLREGFLVLLLGDVPDTSGQALLCAFANQVAAVLRAAGLAGRVRDHGQRLAAVVHAAPNPVVVVDEGGRFVQVNGRAAELFHLAEAFVVGQPVHGRLGNEELEALLLGADDGRTEVVLGTPPNRLYAATSSRVQAPGGRSVGRVLVLDDITGQRETERTKNDFVSVVGHELRTPLTVLKGYVRLLARRAEPGDTAGATAISALESNTERLERLVEDLLFVASIESANPTLDLTSVDVGAALDEFAGTRVVVDKPGTPILMQLDRHKLHQVVHHLLDNALKYSDGEVVVSVVDRGEEVEVRVDDTGPGIFSGDLPQLFERFRQVDGTSTREHGGTGLGLYICRRLVELQGGRIWCESRLGVGSRFAFTLPKGAATTTSRFARVSRPVAMSPA